MNNFRYLFFSRPKGATCWTQTCDAGTKPCHGFPTFNAARNFMQHQQEKYQGFEYYIAEVKLSGLGGVSDDGHAED